MSRTINFIISYTIWLVGLTVAVHFFGLLSMMINTAALIVAKIEMLERQEEKKEEEKDA